jgi:hypothetical protein
MVRKLIADDVFVDVFVDVFAAETVDGEIISLPPQNF